MGEIKKVNDVEVLNVNNELLIDERKNGFKIKNSKLVMTVKKIGSNVYKLAVLLIAAISELVPEFLHKVPLIGYATDAIVAYAKNYGAQYASDEFFNKIICPIFNLPVNIYDPEYCMAYTQFTNHEGKYFQISLIIKTIATFAMEHPGLVLAGGLALAGLVYKLASTILKKYAERMKYHDMNAKQQEVYKILKEVLKKTKKIKKVANGDILVKDLNITFDIIGNLGSYPEMLDRIEDILLNLKNAIEQKNESFYEMYRQELETIVFDFDKVNNNLLNKEMRLIEDEPKESKKGK